ncbi:hypothetical protein LSAT2_028764 [Lamellibrachia satsuma]|nr:hypothetical protein LSAT2_028764 [Lamellibrachia satsuma]
MVTSGSECRSTSSIVTAEFLENADTQADEDQLRCACCVTCESMFYALYKGPTALRALRKVVRRDRNFRRATSFDEQCGSGCTAAETFLSRHGAPLH